MTINNLDLNDSCLKIRAYAAQLEYLMREGRARALADALARIAAATREAEYIANDLLRPK